MNKRIGERMNKRIGERMNKRIGERMNKRIGEIISEKGLKQAFVAEKAGMSQDALSRVLSAKRILKAEELLALCEILEVDPRELGG